MQTEAVIFAGPGRVEYGKVECPDPGPEDVLVRTTHSWISNGTEGSYLRGERSDGDRPRKEGDKRPFPVVAGYQKIGVVESVGENIAGIEVGETVFVTVGRVKGMHHWYGGHVLRSVTPSENVWKLPPDIEPLSFAGLVLAQVGYNAAMRPPVKVGDAAVVVGDGLVGQWTTQALLNRGATVVLAGRHDTRLKYLEDRNRYKPVNTNKEDLIAYCAEHFPNGVSVGVDTVGSIAVMNQLMETSQRYGHLVSAGFYGEDDRMALQPPRYKELSIDLVSGYTRERIDKTLREIALGHIETLKLITHRFSARRAAAAWELIESKSEHVMGVILVWG